MVKLNGFEVLFNTDNLYASETNNPILQIKTYYEQQWLERGLSIKYLQFVPKSEKPLQEPDIEIEHDAYRSFGRSKRHDME
jgi:tRNA (guanine-N7-)-methyltransferase